MPVFTEGRHAAEFILSEANFHRSRDTITIASGEGVLAPGTVVGRIGDDSGTITVTKAAGAGNTGAGDLTLADPAYGAGVVEGVYRVTCVAEATGGGSFTVEDPNGVTIGTAVEGAAFDEVVKFQIDASGADFVVGDYFNVTVAIASAATAGKFKAADPTATDGSATASAIIIYGVDATSADVEVAAITRDAEVNGNILTYDASVDDAPKKAAMVASLATAGIIVR
jgi:hypothetical protein